MISNNFLKQFNQFGWIGDISHNIDGIEIWIFSPKNYEETPYVIISTEKEHDPENGIKFPVLESDIMNNVLNESFDQKTLSKIRVWIRSYRDVLIKYWDGTFDIYDVGDRIL